MFRRIRWSVHALSYQAMQREHDQEAFIWALRRLSNEPVLLWNTNNSLGLSNRHFLSYSFLFAKKACSLVSYITLSNIYNRHS